MRLWRSRRGKGECPSVLLRHNLVEPQTRRSFRHLAADGFVALGLIVAGSNLEGPVTAAARSGFQQAVADWPDDDIVTWRQRTLPGRSWRSDKGHEKSSLARTGWGVDSTAAARVPHGLLLEWRDRWTWCRHYLWKWAVVHIMFHAVSFSVALAAPA